VAKIFTASKTSPPIGIFTAAEFTAFVELDDGQLDWKNRLIDYKEVSYTWTELSVQGQVTHPSPDRVLVITANEEWLPILGSMLDQAQKAHNFYLTTLAHLVSNDNILMASTWRHIVNFQSQQSYTLQSLPIIATQ
jgi:hypothetical protein